MWEAIIGAIAAITTAIIGGASAAKNRKLAKQTAAQQKSIAERPYSLAMKDLKRAGLNPMLVAGKGISTGGQVGLHSAGTEFKGDIAGAFSKTASAAKAIAMKKSEKALVDSQKEVNDQKKHSEATLQDVYMTQAAKNNADTKLSNVNALKAAVEMRTSSAKGANLKANTLAQQYENYRKEARTWMYKGKKGKVISFVDWLLDKTSSVAPVLRK